MRKKLTAIAWKDIYTTFKDRNAMLMMFAMPIAISLIIGFAFGTGSDINIDAVPVAIVNQDSPVGAGPLADTSLGQIYQDAFVPPDDADTQAEYAQIYALTDGILVTDQDRARAEVEDGALTAMITIPPDFTQNALVNGQPVTVSVYYDSGRSIGPSVVRSIVNGITYGINTVILAQQIGPAYLQQVGDGIDADQDAVQDAITRFNQEVMDAARSAPVQLEQVDLEGDTRAFDALQYFAPSMAILFMTFAMAAGATTILTESRQWTLQRIVTTPTPRWLLMAGKLLGTYLTGIVQMVMLIVLTILIARLMGRETSVWGNNVAGLALLVLAVVFAGTSIGLLIAAIAQTPEQASTYSSVALFLLGMLGGSFIPIENLPDALSWLPKITLNYWGIQGFFDLSYDNAPVGDILPNLLVLAVMGTVVFGISLWRFNRRADIGG